MQRQNVSRIFSVTQYQMILRRSEGRWKMPLETTRAQKYLPFSASAIMVAPATAKWFPDSSRLNNTKTSETYNADPVSLRSMWFWYQSILPFYTKLQVDPENLQRTSKICNGNILESVRVRKPKNVNKVLCRITQLGSTGLAFIAVLSGWDCLWFQGTWLHSYRYWWNWRIITMSVW